MHRDRVSVFREVFAFPILLKQESFHCVPRRPIHVEHQDLNADRFCCPADGRFRAGHINWNTTRCRVIFVLSVAGSLINLAIYVYLCEAVIMHPSGYRYDGALIGFFTVIAGGCVKFRAFGAAYDAFGAANVF